jgi:hypothetical protein
MRNASRIAPPAVSVALPLVIFVATVALYVALGAPAGDGGSGAPTLPEPPAAAPSSPLSPTAAPEPSAAPSPETTAPATSAEIARAKLDTITTANSSATGYLRAAFGNGWGDTDRNGCDARNDVLARDLSDVVHRPNTNNCVVHSGVLDDPYTGTVIHFIRGNDTSQLVQIDHVVPLAWAWRYGAANWTHDERVLFHNDQSNLLAVDGPTNMSKSDSGPGDWMPPNPAAQCSYAETYVSVVHAYALSMPDHDRQQLEHTLARC